MAHAIDTNKDLPFEHSVAPILLHEMNGRMQCAKHRNHTENQKPEGDLEQGVACQGASRVEPLSSLN